MSIINNIIPSSGKPGKLVTVTLLVPIDPGDPSETDLQVYVGDTDTQLPRMNMQHNVVYFTVPRMDPGEYPIEILYGRASVAKSSQMFTVEKSGTIHPGDHNRIEVDTIQPPTVTLGSGGLVTVDGSNLGQVSEVKVGTAQVTSGLIITPETLKFRFPPTISRAGNYRLYLTYGPDNKVYLAPKRIQVTKP